MRHLLIRFHAIMFSWRHMLTEEWVALFLVLVVFTAPAAATRLQERSLLMQSVEPGATTSYRLSFRYATPEPVGSVDMLFCYDPIPYHPCVAPAGLNVANAVLSHQSGDTGFSILSKSANHIVLTRLPGMTTNDLSTYTFDNILNPTEATRAFSIRLRTHGTTNATGEQIDFGSVRGQVATGISIETQVPPMLVFCVAQQVEDNCVGTNDNFYTDMGELSPKETLTAQSQMAVGTNASGGFAITANGIPMSAGTSVIDSPTTPTESKKGTNQFGINLVHNDIPAVGENPEGVWANAVASPGYDIPNRYKFVPGDVIAYSPNVSLMKKFTVSYIVNSSENLKAGVYTTTITYIASGRF